MLQHSKIQRVLCFYNMKCFSTKLVFCAALLVFGLTACKNGNVNGPDVGIAVLSDTSTIKHSWAKDISVDGSCLTYVIFFWSDDFTERTVQELESSGDTVGLDNFYTAADDMQWYMAICRDRLEELKAKYYETDASNAVYYPGGVFRTTKDSDCGVLILEPGKNPVFMEYLEFLGSVGWTGE
ncbi:MAG: hypothetical protein K5890_03435 [Bacteroidales bacterium]|nr:hypothetical protein [Bacteroidales bacterium]